MNAVRKQFIKNYKQGKVALSGLSESEKRKLEKGWDIEHAYYSSSLEGSKIDRKKFESYGKKIK